MYSQLSLNRHLYKMDTAVRQTHGVGPCATLFSHFTATKLSISWTLQSLRWTVGAGPDGVRLRES